MFPMCASLTRHHVKSKTLRCELYSVYLRGSLWVFPELSVCSVNLEEKKVITPKPPLIYQDSPVCPLIFFLPSVLPDRWYKVGRSWEERVRVFCGRDVRRDVSTGAMPLRLKTPGSVCQPFLGAGKSHGLSGRQVFVSSLEWRKSFPRLWVVCGLSHSWTLGRRVDTQEVLVFLCPPGYCGLAWGLDDF